MNDKQMNWVSVKDCLPINGQAVLVRYSCDNWHCDHTLSDGKSRKNWRWMAAKFTMGKTKEQVEATGIMSHGDQSGNNLVPYVWKEFGPSCLFGQDVTHWAAISDPCEEVIRRAL